MTCRGVGIPLFLPFHSMKRLSPIVIALLLCLAGCNNKKPSPATPTATVDYKGVAIPTFVADSAYQYVADQLAFGYRTPGSKSAQRCASYLVSQMSRWCDTVIVQDFPATFWDGQSARCKNIIASLRPDCPQRILLAAHWDSRAWADEDPDEANHKRPIPGANDGASGVGALMEMARAMALMPPSVGVDFIFFDAEDQGVASWAEVYEDDSWCKGSQYWATNPHRPYYTAIYGVLFDMVGTANPRFTKEQFSMQYASGVMDKLWQAAEAMGYGGVFQNQHTDPILDDHLYVNRIARIPMVDIVQNSPNCSFYQHWHTLADDLHAIDANTMKMVADVTLKLIYADYGK